jgi:hypothetical protein
MTPWARGQAALAEPEARDALEDQEAPAERDVQADPAELVARDTSVALVEQAAWRVLAARQASDTLAVWVVSAALQALAGRRASDASAEQVASVESVALAASPIR